METSMFLTAKLNLITGMVIGVTAVLAMKQMCNQQRKQKRSSTPNDTPQEWAHYSAKECHFKTHRESSCTCLVVDPTHSQLIDSVTLKSPAISISVPIVQR